MPCRHHMFRNPETGKWGANHILKDRRKVHKIYEALSKKLQAPAPQPTTQLAIQGPPAAAAAAVPPQQHAAAVYAQHQPRQENARVEEEQYPLVRGQLNMIQKGRTSNRCQKLISRQVYQAMASPPAVPDYLCGSEKTTPAETNRSSCW